MVRAAAGIMELLGQLTVVGNVNEAEFKGERSEKLVFTWSVSMGIT
jgi:hypothetical protein